MGLGETLSLLNCDLWICNIWVTWEQVKFSCPISVFGIKASILTRSPCDLYTNSSWRSHALTHTFSLSFFSFLLGFLFFTVDNRQYPFKESPWSLFQVSSDSNILIIFFFQLPHVVWVFNTCLNSQAPTSYLLIDGYWASCVASKNIPSRALANTLIWPALVYCWDKVGIW